MQLWCGIDWAEHHHDVSIVDETGARRRSRLRIDDTAAGFGQPGDHAGRAAEAQRRADHNRDRDRERPAPCPPCARPAYR